MVPGTLIIQTFKSCMQANTINYLTSTSTVYITTLVCTFSHCSGADTRAYDNSDMNPFMLAVEKGLTHLNVAKAMMKKDPGLLSLQMGFGLTVIQWALEKDHHNAFFKVSFRSCQFSLGLAQLCLFLGPIMLFPNSPVLPL